MTLVDLFFQFVFASNILIVFLAGIQEILEESQHTKGGYRRIYLSKLPYIFAWGLLAKTINILTGSVDSFFLPILLVVYFLFRFIVERFTSNRSILAHYDAHFFDPVVIVPVLIAGYTELLLIELLMVFAGICAGLGLGFLILSSIKRRIKYFQNNSSSAVLLSFAFIALIFSFFQFIERL